MIPLPASCTGSTATEPADTVHRVACDIAQLAIKDPALAARIVSGFGPQVPSLHAEFASEVARNLIERDLHGLARTPAGRDFLDTLEAGLRADGADATRQGQIGVLHGARLAAAPNASERATELIRQASQPDPANGKLLGKNLAAEIRSDMNSGAALVHSILSRPWQQDRFLLATDIAANLTDQELLTLAKTPLGHEAVKQMSTALEMPHGLRSVEGRRVDQALDPQRDSYAHHVAQVQSDLYGKGLPISAKGVQVFVVEKPGSHADAVKRTISGENGLGKDADVVIRGTANHQAKYLDAHPVVRGIDREDPSIKERAALGVAGLEANVHAMREEIKAVRELVPADGKTRIINMSWGRDIASLANELAKQVKEDSSAWEVAADTVLRDTGRRPTAEKVRRELAERIAEEMKKQSAQPDNVKRMTTLQSELQLEVGAATRKGLLIFNSAGNAAMLGVKLGDEGLSKAVTDPVKGLVTVGAADLGITSNPRDDAMWLDSAPGAEIAAPGVGLPVYGNAIKPQAASGTSFASPYAASIATLMIAANPKITPTQIHDILLSGRVTSDLPGSADGKGLLDPVKAVAEARKLAGR